MTYELATKRGCHSPRTRGPSTLAHTITQWRHRPRAIIHAADLLTDPALRVRDCSVPFVGHSPFASLPGCFTCACCCRPKQHLINPWRDVHDSASSHLMASPRRLRRSRCMIASQLKRSGNQRLRPIKDRHSASPNGTPRQKKLMLTGYVLRHISRGSNHRLIALHTASHTLTSLAHTSEHHFRSSRPLTSSTISYHNGACTIALITHYLQLATQQIHTLAHSHDSTQHVGKVLAFQFWPQGLRGACSRWAQFVGEDKWAFLGRPGLACP